MKKTIKALFLALLGISVLSCKVGLGSAVDTKAPTITITSPDMSQSVSEEVIIAGIAQDNLELDEVFIDIERKDAEGTPINFKISKAEDTYSLFQKSGDDWISSLLGTVEGDKKSLNFRLAVNLTGYDSGAEFDITILVTDKSGNESKKSKESRSVSIDWQSPTVTVSSPSLIKTYTDAVTTRNSYKEINNTNISQLINGVFTISGTQVEDTLCDHLTVFLDEGTDDNVDDYENVEMRSTPDYIAYKFLQDKNQRNWEVEFDANTFPEKYRTGKHTIRVITESHDAAGNKEVKAQGWFTLWNEADIPWIVAEFGGATAADKTSVYPSCELFGQAFDDDGLAEITIDLFKNIDGVWTKMEDKCSVIDLSKENYPTFSSWSVTSLSDNSDFYITVKCKDKNGIESETTTKYMSVLDTNPPSVVVDQATIGDSIPLTGNGDFTLCGSVTDDGEVSALKVVRIADNNELTQIKYFDQKYAEWSKATDKGYKDVNGNKIWTITMDAETVENKLHTRTFSRTFNIYSDFGIDGKTQKLSTQRFILYAQDNGGCAGIELVAFGGDTEKPEVTFNTIKVNGSKTYDLSSTNILEPFKSGDYVELSGTWKDNTDTLKDSDLSLKWDTISDFGITFTYDDSTKTSGTWKTKKLTPPSSTTAVIYATITDWAGNLGKSNASFYVSSSLPAFERISADTVDGSYKAGSEILLYMEFNKKVTFSGGTPSLTLNTGKTANYKSGNGTSKHIFSYTVEQGDNADILKVTTLNKSGVTWTDTEVSTSTIANTSMVLPTGSNALEANRNIVIDTTSPTISSITAISSSGYYGENAEIFITAKFSEIVNFENLSSLQLTLNSGSGVKTSSVSKSGPDTILFKYKVLAGHNATPLKISGISFGTCNVIDVAGNSIQSKDKTIAVQTTSINIDTTAPATPEVLSLTNNSTIYDNAGVTFSIDYKESTGTKKYSLDGGKSWADYSGNITLLNKGSYSVTAYQEDVAGNQSSKSTPIAVKVDRGTIITSLTANKPDGTYIKGQKISVVVNYRKEVTVSDSSYIVLNTTPVRNATYKSGNGTKKLYFEYTVQEGDTCSAQALAPQNFVGTIKDADNNDISPYTAIASVASPNRFIDNKEIFIITKAPEVTNVAFGGTNESNRTLVITFSANVNKNNGSVTFTQNSSGYIAPAVMTEKQYNNRSAAVKAYYIKGTNGANASGVSDLTPKYVLDYNTSTTLKALTDAFIADKALEVTVPLYSPAVTISKNVMTIDLSGSYKLPVKGATYAISIPAALISDDVTQTNPAYSTSKTLPGVEKPVIRIKKSKEVINADKTVTLPTTAVMKMDCQTPGASIQYVDGSARYATVTLGGTTTDGLNKLKNGYANQGTPSKPAFTNPSTYSTQITIGSKVGNTNVAATDGYKMFIVAKAKVGSEYSDEYYETAYKTVIRTTCAPATYSYMWLRGGDSVAGGNTVSDFPMNWDSSDYSGVRAMYKAGTNDWYWISWNINTIGYMGLLSGDMPDDAATNGPQKWCWATQAFVGYKVNTKIYPGESYTFVDCDLSGSLAFQGKHKESR